MKVSNWKECPVCGMYDDQHNFCRNCGASQCSEVNAEEISQVLDRVLPAEGVGTEREKIRMSLHQEIYKLIQRITSRTVVIKDQKKQSSEENGRVKCLCDWGFPEGDPFGQMVVKEININCRVHTTRG